MTDKKKPNLLRQIRPLHLMTALALSLAGAGIARYLGARMDYAVLGLVISWLLCFWGGVFLVGDYFQTSFVDPILPPQPTPLPTPVSQESPESKFLLFGAVALLSAGGVLTLLLELRDGLSNGVGVIMLIAFGLAVVLIIPGLNIKYSGMGEFLVSINLVLLPPALAFFTQYGEFHRFLSLTIFPLFPLHLALVLTLGLRSYPADVRLARTPLMVRLGWVKGVFLHNLLLLSGFLLFGMAILFDLPVRIGGPVFTALIPAGYLIWVYSGLERGAPVRWPVIILLSLSSFFIPVYLIAFTAWIF